MKFYTQKDKIQKIADVIPFIKLKVITERWYNPHTWLGFINPQPARAI